ncbi:MAG: MBL fold metallo-hydrolase [Pseudomonadota bacterium]|nr:MBL fold metallo-hydrolase [Pseudomonadota bacterium]
MKILKYLIFIVVAAFLLIVILTRIPAVQDRVMTSALNNLQNQEVDLYDNSLTALVCGSRSPLPHPRRAETCILINAGGSYYVIDVGDGSASNLRSYGVNLGKIKAVLLTHLHSDHISDLADIHMGTWVAQSRTKRLDVYGPSGVEFVTKGFEDAYKLDFKYRNEHHGDEVAPINIVGFDPHPVDLLNPVVINENGLKVTAFKVPHDPVKPALGYRFDFKGRSIVISGDTSYSENLITYAKDADVLFHEAQANHILEIMKGVANKAGNSLTAKVLDDITTYHTTPKDAAKVANLANVDHLVFYHLTPSPRTSMMERMFFRGVNKIRKDWSVADDGTMVVLPLDSDEIKISKVN